MEPRRVRPLRFISTDPMEGLRVLVEIKQLIEDPEKLATYRLDRRDLIPIVELQSTAAGVLSSNPIFPYVSHELLDWLEQDEPETSTIRDRLLAAIDTLMDALSGVVDPRRALSDFIRLGVLGETPPGWADRDSERIPISAGTLIVFACGGALPAETVSAAALVERELSVRTSSLDPATLSSEVRRSLSGAYLGLADLLSCVPTPGAFELLCTMLEHPWTDVRNYAANFLHRWRSVDLVERLRSAAAQDRVSTGATGKHIAALLRTLEKEQSVNEGTLSHLYPTAAPVKSTA